MSGKVTIVGTDAMVVKETTSNINTPSSVNDGESFTVDVTGPTTEMNHTVLVYNTNQFTNSVTKFILDKQISSSIALSDLEINHSIEKVSGEFSFDGPVTVYGTTFNDKQITGSTTMASVIDFVVEKANAKTGSNIAKPQTTLITPSSTLDASAAGKATVSTPTFTIQTYENWSAGTYKIIHLAGGRTTGDIHTNIKTIQVNNNEAGGGGGGGGDTTDGVDEQEEPTDDTGGGQPTGGEGEGEGEGVVEEPKVAETPEEIKEILPEEVQLPEDVNVTRAEVNNAIADPKTNTSTVKFTENSSIQQISISEQVTGTVSVVELESEPAETGNAPGRSVSVTQITVPDDAKNAAATIKTRVGLDRVETIGATPDQLTITRFNDSAGEWQTLETSVVKVTATYVELEAETPGFSYFAVSAVSDPVASLDAPTEIDAGTTAEFDAAESSDEFGEVVSYTWKVDNVTVGHGESFEYYFASAGTYTVEVVVENDAGRTDSVSSELTVAQVGTTEEPAPTTTEEPTPEEPRRR